jgi:2-aminoadipate transaminase
MHFASRVERLKPSDIREILKLTENPEVISFAGGVPDPDFFPVEEMKEITRLVLEEQGKKILQYNSTEGLLPLREKIAQRMLKVGVQVSPENLLITSGSQQGLDFSARIFLGEGDAVACESPTYAGAISAFKVCMPEFVEITTDSDGMKLDELEAALQRNKNIKMIYVIPDYQNPTGKLWSMERRKELIRISHEYNIPVVEDNPYGEISFTEEKMPTLKSLDGVGTVVYLGTFSKTLCPGLRVGWLIASNPIIQKYNIVKQGSDIHTNSLAQAEIDQYLELYNFDDHIKTINEVYKQRKNIMIDSIKKYFPANCLYTNPKGGLFIWIEMPEDYNSRDVLLKALDRNVAFIPGESFYPSESKKNTFRLNYSNVAEAMIDEGIKRLSEILKTTKGGHKNG